MAGHFATDATFDQINKLYLWKGMYRDVKNYINACTICQQNIGQKQKIPMHPLSVGFPFDKVGIDLVGPLPKTRLGNRYIVVATDYLTKWPEAFTVPDHTVKTVAQILVTEIMCRHGCLQVILSDRGKEFLSEVMQEVYFMLDRILHIELNS